MSEGDLVVLGRVGGPHGLNGAFCVVGRSELVPKRYREVRVGPSAQLSTLTTITSSFESGGRVILGVAATKSRDEAVALRGQWIYVERSRVGQNDGSKDVHWADLQGVEVYDVEGRRVGVVRHIYNAGASDVLEVEDGQGRCVDIPLAPMYFAEPLKLEHGEGARKVTLLVSSLVFADLWT